MRFATLLWVLIAAPLCLCAGRFNVLFIAVDDLRVELGCYGGAHVKSPNIDRLAAQGVIFDAAYSSSPLCTPARYAFMTGQFISRSGGYDNAAYMPSTMPTDFQKIVLFVSLSLSLFFFFLVSFSFFHK